MAFKHMLLTTTLLAALAASAPARAIVGPTVESTPFADRTVMVLTRGPEGSGFCTGVVLAPRIVLTAAHCLRSPANMLVHYRDERGEPVVLDVAAAAAHPGYRPDAAAKRTRSLDIGLLETKLPLPDRFRAATLAGDAAPSPGDSVIVVGYGISGERKPSTGGALRAAKLTIREPRSDVLLWLKGAEGAGGACAGDSGGPIFSADGATVVAVTAWTEGASGAKCGQLTQGVLVAPVSTWISEMSEHMQGAIPRSAGD